jgi:hypothetical protein
MVESNLIRNLYYFFQLYKKEVSKEQNWIDMEVLD